MTALLPMTLWRAKPKTVFPHKSSKDLYFSKLIKDGEISKEGRDALRDKYYLSPKMYEAWQPPQLEDTKLYFLAPKKNRDSVDAGLLSIHGRIREAAKIGLATLERLASAEDLDNIALTDDFKDTQVGTVEKAKEMIVDMLTMIGQADVATTQTREVSLHPRLNREFVSSLKSLDRKGTKVTRFEANKLFHERLDDVVSRRSKETGLKRILAPARAYNGRSEGWYENSRSKRPGTAKWTRRGREDRAISSERSRSRSNSKTRASERKM